MSGSLPTLLLRPGTGGASGHEDGNEVLVHVPEATFAENQYRAGLQRGRYIAGTQKATRHLLFEMAQEGSTHFEYADGVLRVVEPARRRGFAKGLLYYGHPRIDYTLHSKDDDAVLVFVPDTKYTGGLYKADVYKATREILSSMDPGEILMFVHANDALYGGMLLPVLTDDAILAVRGPL